MNNLIFRIIVISVAVGLIYFFLIAPKVATSPVLDNTTTDPAIEVSTDAELNTGSGGVEIYKGYSFPENSESINLSGKGLTGSLMAEVRHLEDLRALNIGNNAFTGLPAEIGQLSKLEILNVSNNQLTGIPQELGNLTNLKTLDLRGNKISPTDLQIISAQLPKTTIILTD